MDPTRLLSQSLQSHPEGASIARIMAAALRAVDPAIAIQQSVRCEGSTICVGDTQFVLDASRQVFMVGVGKASMPMAWAISEILGDRLTAGLVITKPGNLIQQQLAIDPIETLPGGHPVPDRNSLDNTLRLVTLLRQAGEGDLVFCLISGGGSALMTWPVAGVSLEDLQALTRALLACGATINEMNCLRKHLDQVKGGRLAALAYPAELVTLILSDVVGNPLEVIASGPTVPDPTTYLDAIRVIEKYGIRDKVPVSILNVLEAGRVGLLPETIKAGDVRLSKTFNEVVGSNYQAALAAVDQARKEGFNSQLLTTYLQGEACIVGRMLASVLKEMASTNHPLERPACLVVGGETTVVLKGQGKGGRNQELALSAVDDLEGLKDVFFITLATDGEDGPTDAAGAVVTGQTAQRARQLGLSAIDVLQQNDAYRFFDILGDLIHTGPTSTNVNDLTFLFTV